MNPLEPDYRLKSRTVDWYTVHLFVDPLLEEVGCWPMAGTLSWQRLGAANPAKLAAIFDAARHHALRIETAQAALADASHDVSAAADWPTIARSTRRRDSVYIPRRRIA